MATVLPDLDALPLPAPAWLLSALLVVTFALHVVPMAMTLGGGFWAVVAARRADDAAFRLVAERVGKGLPYWTAATVTTGVAALLFLQVLYGPVFYASTVVTAWPWLSIVGLVLAGYSGYYFRAFRWTRSPSSASWVGLLAWIAFAGVAFLYVHEMTLMLHPERFHALYLADRSGATLSLADATLALRYLHMLVGAVALAALWIGWLGATTSGEAGRRVVEVGARGFVLATALQVVLGAGLLAALPGNAARALMGASPLAAAYLALAVVATFGAAVAAWRARTSDRPAASIRIAAAHAAGVVVLMVLVRDVVRRTTLGGAARLEAMPVAPQWGMIALFLVLLVAGLATVGWMVAATRRRGAARAPAAE